MSYNSTLQGGIMRLWWIPLFTGLLSIALGIWCLCSPVASMKVFAYVFAACLCAGGIVNLIFAGVNSRIGWNWGVGARPRTDRGHMRNMASDSSVGYCHICVHLRNGHMDHHSRHQRAMRVVRHGLVFRSMGRMVGHSADSHDSAGVRFHV